MKLKHKEEVRLFIIQALLELDDLRWKLDGLADTYDMDPIETIECFEQEVERINKFFCYPGQ